MTIPRARHTPPVRNRQRSIAAVANTEIQPALPARTSSRHRRCSCRASIAADIAGRRSHAPTFRDRQRAGARVAYVERPCTLPARTSSRHRRCSCRASIVSDRAIRTSHRAAAVRDRQGANAQLADEESIPTLPTRPSTRHRRRACRAGIGADRTIRRTRQCSAIRNRQSSRCRAPNICVTRHRPRAGDLRRIRGRVDNAVHPRSRHPAAPVPRIEPVIVHRAGPVRRAGPGRRRIGRR